MREARSPPPCQPPRTLSGRPRNQPARGDVLVERGLHLGHPGRELLLQRREQHLRRRSRTARRRACCSYGSRSPRAARQLLQPPVARREPVRPLQLDDAQVAAHREVDDGRRHVERRWPARRAACRSAPAAGPPAAGTARRPGPAPTSGTGSSDRRRRPAPARASGRRSAGRGRVVPTSQATPARPGQQEQPGERAGERGRGQRAGAASSAPRGCGPVAVTAPVGSPTTTVKALYGASPSGWRERSPASPAAVTVAARQAAAGRPGEAGLLGRRRRRSTTDGGGGDRHVPLGRRWRSSTARRGRRTR